VWEGQPGVEVVAELSTVLLLLSFVGVPVEDASVVDWSLVDVFVRDVSAVVGGVSAVVAGVSAVVAGVSAVVAGVSTGLCAKRTTARLMEAISSSLKI